MNTSRILAPVAAVALAATTALTAPGASALPANPVSPPNGATDSCVATLATTSNVPGSAGGQNNVSIPGTVSVGVQNWVNPDQSPGFRPWVRAYCVAERWMTDTNITFTTDGIDGEYSVRPHTDVPASIATVPVTRSFDAEVGENGRFTADLGDFNAEGTGWGATNGALWYVQGPAGTVVGDGEVDGTISLTTTLLPWPQENINCQPLGVSADAARTVVADGSGQDTGATVTAGDADDHGRMYGVVYLPGTDTVVEDADVIVNADGTVSIEVSPEVRDRTGALEVQLRAQPRDDAAEWEAYNVDWNVGERFTVNLGAQADDFAPGYFHTITHPEVAITLNQRGDDSLPDGTTFALGSGVITDPDIEGWDYTLDETTGALTVTPPEGAETGNYIVIPVEVTYPDGSTETIHGHVTVVERDSITIVDTTTNEDGSVTIEFSDGTTITIPPGTPGTPGEQGPPGEDASSIFGSSLAGSSLLAGSSGLSSNGNGNGGGSSDDRCVGTAAAVGLPLLALAPLAVADQVEIPGLTPLVRQAQQAMQETNTRLQQGSGIDNPEIAAAVEQFTDALGPDAARLVGGAGALALGLVAVSVVADACTPGGSSDLSS